MKFFLYFIAINIPIQIMGQSCKGDTIEFKLNNKYVDKIVIRLEEKDTCGFFGSKDAFCNYFQIYLNNDFFVDLDATISQELANSHTLPTLNSIFCKPFRYKNHRFQVQQSGFSWYTCVHSPISKNDDLFGVFLDTSITIETFKNICPMSNTIIGAPCFITYKQLYYNIQGVVNSDRDKQSFPSGKYKSNGVKDILNFNVNGKFRIDIDPLTIGLPLNQQKFKISLNLVNACGQIYVCEGEGPFDKQFNKDILSYAISAIDLKGFPLSDEVICTEISFMPIPKISEPNIIVIHGCLIQK